MGEETPPFWRGCVGPPTSRSTLEKVRRIGLFERAAADSSSLRSSEHNHAPKSAATHFILPHLPLITPRAHGAWLHVNTDLNFG